MDYQFVSGQSYAITGPNGSGKSTFLKTLSGAIPATEGTISFEQKSGQAIEEDAWPHYQAYAAPYLELIEEFTLKELLRFHFAFKQPVVNSCMEELAEKMVLSSAYHKEIKYFSSGMKQRLKLGLAFFSQVPILLLDEPTSNLDSRGIDWYLERVTEVKNDRLLIICSNQKYEYQFCEKLIDITDFKRYKQNK